MTEELVLLLFGDSAKIYLVVFSYIYQYFFCFSTELFTIGTGPDHFLQIRSGAPRKMILSSTPESPSKTLSLLNFQIYLLELTSNIY